MPELEDLLDVRERESGAREYRCSSWEDFGSVIRVLRYGKTADRIYRGQHDPSWTLQSRFERSLSATKASFPSLRFPGDSFEQLRSGYLARFREYVAGTGWAAPGLDEDQLWALGRHHGLITPLLDWTRSPYVAAFFAFGEHEHLLTPGFNASKYLPTSDEYVAVWVLRFAEGQLVPREFDVIAPATEFGYRQRAQRGRFSRLQHDEHLDLESYLAARGLADCLELVLIPAREMGKALDHLEMMNINYSTLFPDLDGAAKQANLTPFLGQSLELLGLLVSDPSLGGFSDVGPTPEEGA